MIALEKRRAELDLIEPLTRECKIAISRIEDGIKWEKQLAETNDPQKRNFLPTPQLLRDNIDDAKQSLGSCCLKIEKVGKVIRTPEHSEVKRCIKKIDHSSTTLEFQELTVAILEASGKYNQDFEKERISGAKWK